MNNAPLRPVPEFTPRVAEVKFARDGRGPYSLALKDPESTVKLARALAAKLEGEPREHFFVILLDTRLHVLGIYVASIGGIDRAHVDPRSVYLAAVAAGASAILVAHNHPSGDPTPSPADIATTQRLREGGEILGIELLDSLIVTPTEFYSIASRKRVVL